MKILIVGFQRSGTTLLRRIFHVHPGVRRMFHEQFLLRRCSNVRELEYFLMNYDIDPRRDNWGEKVPFYPSARGIGILAYCKKWKDYFPGDGKIIHIVRHPLDVAHSVENKYGGKKFKRAIQIYKKIMPTVVPNLLEDESVYSVKYEDLLLNPDDVVARLYGFCGIKKVKFRKHLSRLANARYQKIDPSRAFAYKKKPIPLKLKLKQTLDILNKIPGPEYKL